MGREAGWLEYLMVLLAPLLSLALVLNLSPASYFSEQVTDEQLAIDYAPIMVFDAQERLRPMDAGTFINDSQLWSMRTGTASLVAQHPYDFLTDRNMTGALSYLDNRYGGIDDDGVIAAYGSNASQIISFVHVSHDTDRILLQYWFFYAFNYGPINRHEGDWEMYQVVLDANQRPLWAMVSQHHGGERMAWNELSSQDGHVRVYVELGSHANHLMSPENVTQAISDNIMLIGMNATSTPWIDYPGRWGEWGGTLGDVLGRRGPEGPMFREGGQMWNGIAWGMALPLEVS